MLMLLLAFFTMSVSAETYPEVEEVQNTNEKKAIELPQWVQNIKFSGYGMLQYQAQDKDNAHTNSFNLRLARFILDGKIGDFDWRAQIQGTNAKGPAEPIPMTSRFKKSYGYGFSAPGPSGKPAALPI